jgi:hypothetical protein
MNNRQVRQWIKSLRQGTFTDVVATKDDEIADDIRKTGCEEFADHFPGLFGHYRVEPEENDGGEGRQGLQVTSSPKSRSNVVRIHCCENASWSTEASLAPGDVSVT